MTSITRRLRLSAILTPALLLPLIWVYYLSPAPHVLFESVFVAFAYAVAIAFTAAYCITLYIAESHSDRDRG